METRGNKHTLTIRNVQGSDFGNYSCVADNSLGRAKKYMELSGRPSPAEFKSTPYSRAKDSYNLTWVVESYPPLEEVRLLYRKLMVCLIPFYFRLRTKSIVKASLSLFYYYYFFK